MDKDFNQLSIEFDTKARPVFFALFHAFEQTVQTVNRQKNENYFQQLQSQYASTLKSQLGDIAKELIFKNGSLVEVQQLQHSLYSAIDHYTKEFLQKAKSL
jgi:hypothetical protein